MPRFPFEKGVHDLGGGAFAWIQPDGSWGYSNAGVVVDGRIGLLVDTLFDLHLTREMLAAYDEVAGPDLRWQYLALTHGNGDHVYGNQLVTGAEIVASRRCTEDMNQTPPSLMADMIAGAPSMGDAGKYFRHCFGAFDFTGIEMAYPTIFVEGDLELAVGEKIVRLMAVGPDHTAGGLMVHVPDAGVLYAGDILFVGGMPIMWGGPYENWIAAIERILWLDADIIVPGHGPVTDKAGVARYRAVLEEIHGETRRRFDAGQSPKQASAEMAKGGFSDLTDAERIVIMVHRLYHEFDPSHAPPDVLTLFALMAEIAREKNIIS